MRQDVLDEARRELHRCPKQLKKVLAEHGPALVFAMIQKYRDTDTAKAALRGPRMADDDETESFGVLNTD